MNSTYLSTLLSNNSLKLDHHPTRGRRIISTKSFSPGDTIFCEKPYAHCVSDKLKSTHCHYCLRKPDQLYQCPRCKQAKYCSQNCQQSDWKDHKIECKCYNKLAPKVPTESIKLMARVLHRRWRETKEQIDGPKYEDFCSLVSRKCDVGEVVDFDRSR